MDFEIVLVEAKFIYLFIKELPFLLVFLMLGGGWISWKEQMVRRVLTTPALLTGDQDFLNGPVLNHTHMLPNLAKLLLVASFFVIFFPLKFLSLCSCQMYNSLPFLPR